MKLTKYVFVLMLVVLFSQQATAKPTKGKKVYGRVEGVTLLPDGIRVKAKLDTGARTASLSATKVKVFTRGDKKLVRFQLSLNGNKVTKELPLYRYAKIKKRFDAINHNRKKPKRYSRRPVVKMNICLDNEVKEISVNLVNRKHFRYPMLLGRDAIRAFNGIVDPGQGSTGSDVCKYKVAKKKMQK